MGFTAGASVRDVNRVDVDVFAELFRDGSLMDRCDVAVKFGTHPVMKGKVSGWKRRSTGSDGVSARGG